MNTQSEGSVEPKAESPIQVAINRLDTDIQALRSHIERVETKLAPVLASPSTAQEDDGKNPEVSPMEGQLDSLHRNLIAECVRLDNILQRLQI